MGIKVYIEGGVWGDKGGKKSKKDKLKIESRKGFEVFLIKAGLERIGIALFGKREQAFKAFCCALSRDKETPVLLVDSEISVKVNSAWLHLRQKECGGWKKPNNANDEQAHLMVQCMESWLIADVDNLKRFYGSRFNAKALPNLKHKNVEDISKDDLYPALENATKNVKTKGAYHKGKHSFKLLETTNPSLVISASPYAKRFVDTLKELTANQ